MALSPEALLISSVLRNRDYAVAVARGARAEMFHAFPNEYKWLETYYKKHRREPSKVAFKNNFPEFPLKAVDDTPHFTDEVKKMHARHMILEALSNVADELDDGDIMKAGELLSQASSNLAVAMGVVSETDILSDYEGIYDEVKARADRVANGGLAGVPTGFDTLDEVTGGPQAGQLWIMAARLGEGKSWALIRMAASAILQGYRVHYASLEMTQVEVAMRVHNVLSGEIGKTIFNSMNLAQGKDVDMKEYRQFLRDLKSQVSGFLTVSDTPNMNAMSIRSQMERYQPDLYLLDYLTLADTGGDGGWQDIGKFSKELKIAAKEYGLPVVAAAQLNRENGLGRQMPGPEALSGADAIGQDADYVITMKKRTETVTEYKIVKSRHGGGGYGWFMNMNLVKGVFKEITYHKAQDLIDKDNDKEAERRERAK